VVVGLDGFELDIEEIVGVQRGFFLVLFWLGGGGERSWGTAEVEVCGETCDTGATQVERNVGLGRLGGCPGGAKWRTGAERRERVAKRRKDVVGRIRSS